MKTHLRLLFGVVGLGTFGLVAVPGAAGRGLQMLVVAEQTDPKSAVKPPKTDHPADYVAFDAGYVEAGDPIANEKPPASSTIAEALRHTLAEQGYQPAAAGHPQILFVYHWGLLNRDSHAIRNGATIDPNLHARLALLTTTKQDGEIDEPDEWDTFIYSSGEELIPLADGTFRPKNESDFTRFQREGTGWLATQSDGTRLRFGTTGDDVRVITGLETASQRSRELADIRTPADNEAAADFLLEQVRSLVENPDLQLIASVAGGRKTMDAIELGVQGTMVTDTLGVEATVEYGLSHRATGLVMRLRYSPS